MRKLYYKLVRDRIPEVIEEAGKEFSVSQADSSSLRDYAMKKLREEVSEFIEDPCAEEAADILEILDFICRREDWAWERLAVTSRKLSRSSRNIKPMVSTPQKTPILQ